MAILGPDFGGLPFRPQMTASSAPGRVCDLGDAVRVVADRLRRLKRCAAGASLSSIVEGQFPILDPFGDAERVLESLLSGLLLCHCALNPEIGVRASSVPPVYLEVLSHRDDRGDDMARLMVVMTTPSASALAQQARAHLIETSLPERIDALRGTLNIADLRGRVIFRLDFPLCHPAEPPL